MFFSEEELIKMTGSPYPKYQTKWLSHHGLPFTWSNKGKLNVLIEDYIKKFGLKMPVSKRKDQEPEFDVLREINGKKTQKTQAFTAKGNL